MAFEDQSDLDRTQLRLNRTLSDLYTMSPRGRTYTDGLGRRHRDRRLRRTLVEKEKTALCQNLQNIGGTMSAVGSAGN